ncbi:hypothetical protein LCGC14_0569560 [marine sediment metagenome]|uniref:Uncharacterized protein n=1 Tax=marine sediment metagenome TaxID=412755 RepID=A0A0F9S397_9ZZZZ
MKRTRSSLPSDPGYVQGSGVTPRRGLSTQAQHFLLQSPSPNILSIDAGFTKFGWAVFSNHEPIACGVIQNKAVDKKTVAVSNEYQTMASFLARALRGIYTEHNCQALVGELPHGGGLSARAVSHMNMSTAIVGAVTGLLDIPCEFCSPTDVKIATCGTTTASKLEMMKRIIEMYNGYWDTKRVRCKASVKYPEGYREDYIWNFRGGRYGSGLFEHVADSCGAYLALADSNLIKLLGS